MLIFDKQEIRDFLSEDNMMDLLQEFGGDPERTKFGIICTTICHNPPGDGSRKLYWYSNTGLFRCYTGCDEPIFDIFELVIKVMNIQHHINMDLNEAVRWVASKFGFVGRNEEINPEDRLDDWTFLANYDRIQDIKEKSNHVILKEYDTNMNLYFSKVEDPNSIKLYTKAEKKEGVHFIYKGEEYIENDCGEYAHWDCIDYGRDLAKFLGYEIKEMEEINDEYNI